MRPRALTLAYAAPLFVLNAYLTRDLFHTDYTTHMGSIEAAFISLARYVSRHWNDLGWFPLWYGGIPYPDTYPPLLHWMVAAVISFTHVTPGLAYHFTTALLYSLGPVTFFWMAWRLCASRACAFAAALGYSLISPTSLLIQPIHTDAAYWSGARRLQDLVQYGEGPHVAALCLLPLAIAALQVAFEKHKPSYWLLAALAIASVPMTNWLGAMALAMAITAYLFAGWPKDFRRPAAWLRAGLLGIYAYALVMPWLSPATIAVIRANAPRIANDYRFHITNRLFVAAVALFFLLCAWLMSRWRTPRHIRFALLLLLVTASSVLGNYWLGLSLVPQPGRYDLEMDMAVWLAAAFLIWPLTKRLNRRVATALAAVAILACVPLVKQQRHAIRWLERPIDIHRTIEYKAAQWLNENRPGARVFVPGSISFWLNAFSDAPQVAGGFDNGITNPLLVDVVFQMYAGENQQMSVSLMRAFGVDAILAGGKDSAEFYHPYWHPERFAGLTELWRDGGDVIYEIPRRNRSLAHVMRPDDLARGRPAATSPAEFQPYLAALDNAAYPAAAFSWRAPSVAIIHANLDAGQILSVQISWDKGWNASVAGRPVPIRRDRLGQMVIEPQCSGLCTVDLVYDGGAEGRWARRISGLSLAAGVFWLIAAWWRTPRQKRRETQ